MSDANGLEGEHRQQGANETNKKRQANESMRHKQKRIQQQQTDEINKVWWKELG